MEKTLEVLTITTSEAPFAQSSIIEDIKGMEPNFFRAAIEGNIDPFKEKGEEIQFIQTPNKNTILHIHFTSLNVSEPFVEEILRICPPLLMKANDKGETLLHIASRYGHSKIVSILIARDRSLIRAINDKKDTALHDAVCFRHIEIVNILTKEDRHYSYSGNSDGETPLYLAAEREYMDVVFKLLENCKSPNQNGPNGRTALHAAVIRHNKEMMLHLLTRTSANQADENGWVPLHLAALRESADLTEELLKYDRNTAYKRDKKGRTALHFAARYAHVKVMEKIIEYCPDCAELVDENSYNALHYSSFCAYATKMILDNTSLSNLYNQKDNNGNTPLHHLARTPCFDEVDCHPLLETHPRVDTMAFNGQNQTAVDIAYHNLHNDSTPKLKFGNLAKKLGKVGASYGGRIAIKNEKKKKKEEEEAHEHDSIVAIESETNKKSKEDIEIKQQAYDDRVRETNMVVAALIATVTFAAGFTMPGGFIQEHDQPHKGSPILMHNPAFQAFVITDTFSFVFSLSAVFLQLFSSTVDDRYMTGVYLQAALILSRLAMVFMIVAFGTGTYAILGVSKALAIVTLLIVMLFFFIYYFGVKVDLKYYPDEEKEKEEGRPMFPNVDGPILKAQRIDID